MATQGRLGAAVWGWLVVLAIAPAAASLPVETDRSRAAAESVSGPGAGPSEDAEFATRWVVASEDNRSLPYAIVDKKRARLYVYAATGRLVGASPVLLGLSVGDASVADIATRPPSSLTPAERTTPAGRYASEPGHNAQGEDIVWIDYAAALAIHRLRPSPTAQRRDERMGSPRSEDRRISYGCVVVPVAFYDAYVRPLLGSQRGVVYVLPETRPLAEMLRSERSAPRTP